MKNLCRTDVRIGEPLPWPVYDRKGRLLLRQGVCIAFEHQIDRLAEQGMFVREKDAEALETETAGSDETPCDVFDGLLACSWSLKLLLTGFFSQPVAPDLVRRVRQRAARMMAACRADPEAALASLHLDFRNPYPLAHPVHAAVLCELIGLRLGVPKAERLSTLCAALTCDIGMFDFPCLEKQAAALDDDQAAAVRRHPARAAALLAAAGVDDKLWLDVVLCHHERWNGSGYPEGTARTSVPRGARILAVADSYAAMIKARPHRGSRPPFEVHGEIFRTMGVLYDPEICGALVKEIGMYPPGSFVRLWSAETAVVKTRRHDGEWSVYAIYGADDLPYLSPQRRNAMEEGFAIAAVRAQGECRASEAIVRRLWR